jgi:hypothetical protein
MSNRKDIMAPRKKKDGGTYWVKIGTAWENEKGTQLVFDALPLPDNEGRVVANLFEPREPQQRQQGGGYQQQNTRQDDDLGADSIPF